MADEVNETTQADAKEVIKKKRVYGPTKKVHLDMQKWLEPDGLLLITAYAREGLGREDIAKKMGIGKTTLRRWEVDFKEVREALKNGRERADAVVENSLYKSANGYTVTLKKPMKLRTVKVKDGARIETEEIQYVEEEVHIPGNVTAQIYYLKNRKPDVWNDRPQPADTLGAAGPLVTIINDIPRDTPAPERQPDETEGA